VSRKVVRLTLDHLDELTAPCRSCVFWQLDPVRRGRVDDPADEVDAWVSAVLRDWGSCGRVVLVDGVPKGFALYAPEAFLPGAASFPTAPVSADAVLLTQVYVAPDARRGGLGRMLVQGMARDLIERGGIKAVEAFGDTRGDIGWDTSDARGFLLDRRVGPEFYSASVFLCYQASNARITTPSAMRYHPKTTNV